VDRPFGDHARQSATASGLSRRQALVLAASLAPVLAARALPAAMPGQAAASDDRAIVLYRGWILTARDIEALASR